MTFAEVRRHLGVETQRQWSDKAIARTTPVLLGLFSLVTLFENDIHRADTIVVRAKWSRKDTITFSDALAAVRHQLWADETCRRSLSDADLQKVRQTILDRLTELACYAA